MLAIHDICRSQCYQNCVFLSTIMIFTETVRITMTVRFWISIPDAMYTGNTFNIIMPIAFHDNCVQGQEPMSRPTPSLESHTGMSGFPIT